MKSKQRISIFLFFFFLSLIFFYVYIEDYKLRNEYLSESTSFIDIRGNNINYSSLELKQKLAQMVIVRGDDYDSFFNKLNVGGIYLDDKRKNSQYFEVIEKYKNYSKISLFVSTSLDGKKTPFKKTDPFNNVQPEYIFPTFSEINNFEKAYDLGRDHAKILRKSGFNLNFAPVSEFYGGDTINRVFNGSKNEVKQKLALYITGLNSKNLYSTCKYYPGNSLISDSEFNSETVTIRKENLGLFEICYNSNATAIIVGHQIVDGILNSKGKPSSLSREVISTIHESVLVISDEVDTIPSNFKKDKKRLYVELINAGNDMILDLKINSIELYEVLDYLEKAINDGKISEERIDKSVEKILLIKGYDLE